MKEDVKRSIEAVRAVTDFVPEIAIVLGSGLGSIADRIETVCEISYKDLPGFPVSTAPGHAGRFIMGYLEGVPVICMKGRIHYYEGWSPEQVVMPVRVMAGLGAQTLIVTNASGGIRADYRVGSIAMITDHIALFCENPLIGPNDDEEGVRFPDMTEAYDRELQDVLRKAAAEEGITLETGVYIYLTGPSFETPAEIRMCRTLGADLVGMSTVPEVIAARHIGMRVCGLSMVANMAAGIAPHKLTEQEVLEAGEQAGPVMVRLLTRAVRMMGQK